MYQYHCLNNIAEVGLKKFDGNYAQTDKMEDADAILVRSAVMHDMEFSDKLCVIGRAGAGVNNIPLGKCSEQGIAVFNTPGANANGVKELVYRRNAAGSQRHRRRYVLGTVRETERRSGENG